MTTMELIEKHGIGANCLSDAYDVGVEQGRADAEEEHEKMCESCIHKVSAEDIEQIRADAIDEFVKYIDTHSHISADGCDICLDDDITILAEQIKEQKNEID